MTDLDLQFGGYGAAVTVETGAGLADADSYLSLAEATARIAQRGAATAWAALASDLVRNDMLRASAAFGIDAMFGPEWQGVRSLHTQALDWPRIGVVDRKRNYPVLQSEIPEAVKWAQVEYLIALLAGVNPLRMTDPADDGGKAFATSTSDSLPGGFNESRTFSGGGAPVLPVLTRLGLTVWPLLIDRDRVVLS